MNILICYMPKTELRMRRYKAMNRSIWTRKFRGLRKKTTRSRVARRANRGGGARTLARRWRRAPPTLPTPRRRAPPPPPGLSFLFFGGLRPPWRYSGKIPTNLGFHTRQTLDLSRRGLIFLLSPKFADPYAPVHRIVTPHP